MTDTDKWKNNSWFRKLPKDYKLFWLYLNDDCDNAGVWEVDIELANLLLGTNIDRENIFKNFKHRIYEFESKNKNLKYWIIGFCDFQYSGKGKPFDPSNPVNRPQESYVNLLKYHKLLDLAIKFSKNDYSLSIPYAKGINSLKDKDKDKDKDKELKLIKYWNNNICAPVPKVEKITKDRKAKIRIRLTEKEFDYETAIRKINESDFLSGRSGDWSATFDWFIGNDKNYIKILEGNYDNKLKSGDGRIGHRAAGSEYSV